MSAPSPLVPEGAIPSKGKSNVRIAIFTILAIHVVLLGGLLIQGCKPSNKDAAKSELPPLEQQPVATTTTPTEAIDPSLPVDPTVAVAPAPELAVAPVPTPTPAVVTPAVVAPAPVSTPVATPSPVTAIPPYDPVPAVASEMKVHAVAKGEMLSTIAKKYKVGLKALTEANPTVNPTKLRIGQKLNIPSSATRSEAVAAVPGVSAESADVYVVKSGDALEKIARNNKTTVKAIKELNNMRTDRIKVGDKLKLPVTTSAAVETTPAPYTVPTEVASAPATTTVH